MSDQAKQGEHQQNLIAALMNPNEPKTEKEWAAVVEIEILRAEREFAEAHIASLQNRIAQASAEVVALEDEVGRLRALARDILETAEGFNCYTPEYFQLKHDHPGRIAAYKALLNDE
jgi:hypothetical protein